MNTVQHYRHPVHGAVAFIDNREQVYSDKAQPRDIQILTDLPADAAQELREEIAVDIRLACGATSVGVRKGLKW